MAYMGLNDGWGGKNDPGFRSIGDAFSDLLKGGVVDVGEQPGLETDPTTGNTRTIDDINATIGNIGTNIIGPFTGLVNALKGNNPQATLPPMQVSEGPSMMTIALIGGVAVLGIILLKKKRK